MTYKLTVDPKPTHLHFIVTGENTEENVFRYMEEVMQECTDRNCRNILIEERLDGPRLNMAEIFSMVSQGARRFTGMLQALAYVDVNSEGTLMQFAETVAVNRGIPIRVFKSVADAEQWLLQFTPSAH